MILFIKKIWFILLALILYISIVLLCISSVANMQSNWFMNAFSYRLLMFNIIPFFLIMEYLIDDTISSNSIIRCSSRKKAMCLQLMQQYAFALIYLTVWFIMITVFALFNFNGIDKLQVTNLIHNFYRYLLEFMLLINVSVIIKRMNLKMLSHISYIFTYILLILDFTFVIRISRSLMSFTGTYIGLVFSWILIDTNFSTIFMIILVCISTYMAFFYSSKADIF